MIDRDKDDTPEWTEADFARAKPASEAHGPEAAAALVRTKRAIEELAATLDEVDAFRDEN